MAGTSGCRRGRNWSGCSSSMTKQREELEGIADDAGDVRAEGLRVTSIQMGPTTASGSADPSPGITTDLAPSSYPDNGPWGKGTAHVMRLTSVGKRYARRPWVLTGIDLDVAAGRIIAISGPNGSGKSTLLSIMAGLTSPTAGTIAGRPRSIGYVPERFPVQNRMSAGVYLRHMGRIRGLSTGAATRRATMLLDRFDMTGGSDTLLRHLSKGNAQRVGLIQALLVRPDLLILDEPGTGMDELGHDVLSEIIEEVARDGGAVVLSSPFHSWGPTLATRYQLSDGRLRGSTERETTAAVGTPVRIVLRRGRDARDLPASWSAYLTAQPADAELSATLPNGESDRRLLEALHCGWAVLSVLPHRPDPGGHKLPADEPNSTPPPGRGGPM